ncbi:hypothetical protein Bca52824_002785 [Brassica carinata]|uniref:FKB95-like N-terminal Kelch domain-containing protein n=1 Tax=Brassica carinata TaxID=52824 RepID=A0A8X7WMQ2_BRACI|nr:hypothetical protein Bca52824_002785 [Brassica carinata]
MNNGAVADFIDGKIYVIGECLCDDEVSGKGKGWRTRVKVYDTETQMWEPEIAKPKIKPGTMLVDDVVMENKIYMRHYNITSVYEPKENKWELDEMLNSKEWVGACVIDNELYYYDKWEKKLRVYDPKQKYWKVVKGLEELLPLVAGSSGLPTTTVSYGGKLALFFQKYQYAHAQRNTISIWCAEIALERRQKEIWGKVQWCDVVLDSEQFTIVKCLAVMV